MSVRIIEKNVSFSRKFIEKGFEICKFFKNVCAI